jgi:chemotaxis signal transduction protein
MTTGGVHVSVRVGTETYAMAIENVLEVAELGTLTTVPGAGAALLGVRNFHGRVLPFFDLACILGSPGGGPQTRILVAEQGDRLAGLAVDAVTEVAPLAAGFADAESEYLTHAVLQNGRLTGVLDVESVFSALARASSP